MRQEQRLWSEKEAAQGKEAEKDKAADAAAGAKDGAKDGGKDGAGAGAAPDANGVTDKAEDAANGH